MAAVTIRNLPDDVHRALKARASSRNRSTEAEMRAILGAAALPEGRVGFGTQMRQLAQRHGVRRADVDAMRRNIRELRDLPERAPVSFD